MPATELFVAISSENLLAFPIDQTEADRTRRPSETGSLPDRLEWIGEARSLQDECTTLGIGGTMSPLTRSTRTPGIILSGRSVRGGEASRCASGAQ